MTLCLSLYFVRCTFSHWGHLSEAPLSIAIQTCTIRDEVATWILVIPLGCYTRICQRSTFLEKNSWSLRFQVEVRRESRCGSCARQLSLFSISPWLGQREAEMLSSVSLAIASLPGLLGSNGEEEYSNSFMWNGFAWRFCSPAAVWSKSTKGNGAFCTSWKRCKITGSPR